MEILSLTASPAKGFEAAKETAAGAAREAGFPLAGVKASAPPGPEPPPPPIKVATEGEGAILEPNAQTQDPDFSSKLQTQDLELMEVAAQPLEAPPELPCFEASSELQVLASLGQIVLPPASAEELSEDTEGQTGPIRSVDPLSVGTELHDLKEHGSTPSGNEEERLSTAASLDRSTIGSRAAASIDENSESTDADSAAVRWDGERPKSASGKGAEKADLPTDGAKPSAQDEQNTVQGQNVARTQSEKFIDPAVEPDTASIDDIAAQLEAKSVKVESNGQREPAKSWEKDAPISKPAEKQELQNGELEKFNGQRPVPPLKEADPGDASLTGERPKDFNQSKPTKDETSDIKGISPEPKPIEHLNTVAADGERPKPVSFDGQKPAPLSQKQTESVLNQVVDRIESLSSGRTSRRVTIHLDPKDFGSITLIVRQSGKDVDAEIYASNEAVRHAIDAGQKHLHHGLEQRGIQLGSMTVGQEFHAGSGRQDTDRRDFSSQVRHFAPPAANHAATTLSLDAIRASSRKASGVDLWI